MKAKIPRPAPVSPQQSSAAHRATLEERPSSELPLSEPPSLQSQQETAERFGHHLERIPVSSQSRIQNPLQKRALAPQPVQRLAEMAPPNRTGLPDSLKAGIEAMSGVSLDRVKVHYNSSKPAQLNAYAYAQDQDIHVAPGQEQHLPHEAWHIIQQAQGRVRATMQMQDGLAVNDEHGLEREAEVMGARAAQLQAKSAAHGSGCGCGCCAGGQQAVQSKAVQSKAVRGAPVQLCVHCGDNSCIKGEKCGYDRSMGGLFTTDAPAVLPYYSSNAKKQSGKAFGTELEHPIPGQALRLMGQGGGYRQEYVVPTDTAVHRGAVSGAGGGISSTGSSSTSRGWAQHLANLPTNFDVVRSSLTEQINAHLTQEAFSESVAQQLSDWLVAQQQQAGRITAVEREQLQTLLMNRYLDNKK
ncbi:DUF4157 domain-containing protein [Archangium violaceum]|uniref:eCIS core domain-containing protein n=1 Tax=Archangium violaceum TaxID=83451 RepID=UPI00193B039B|nr:DUF4157 domain-containing protein [Archangium violaceum]QRK06072.1 DUF4157 domain-containing protein [Archangium violaceum]